jgi:two-component system phosphate regulon response regulator PhoB/two-component system alkaline phosphatase synthesis response regulator PhoP
MMTDEIKLHAKRRIAVVEDEPDIARLVVSHLRKEGFFAESYLTAEAFLGSLQRQLPHLVLLDLMLPDADGRDICRLLKSKDAWRSIPIIIVTAKGEETDRILGLELGADDYVTKPYSLKELAARIRAVLRRMEDQAAAKVIDIGGLLTIDLDKHEVRSGEGLLDLTTTEFNLLSLLAAKKGRVFTRDQILDHLWGHDKIVLDRTIDVHIKNLREKLGPAARFIQNIRGVGYKVEE